MNGDFLIFPADKCFLCDEAIVSEGGGRHGHRTIVDKRADMGTRPYIYAMAALQRATHLGGPTTQSRLVNAGPAVAAVICKPCYTKGDKANTDGKHATSAVLAPSEDETAKTASADDGVPQSTSPPEHAEPAGSAGPAQGRRSDGDGLDGNDFLDLSNYSLDDAEPVGSGKENVRRDSATSPNAQKPGPAAHGSSKKGASAEMHTVCITQKANGDESQLKKVRDASAAFSHHPNSHHPTPTTHTSIPLHPPPRSPTPSPSSALRPGRHSILIPKNPRLP